MELGDHARSMPDRPAIIEAGPIVDDGDASVPVCSCLLSDVARRRPALARRCPVWVMSGANRAGWLAYEDLLAGSSPERLAEGWLGDTILYRSGTAGRAKGVLRPLLDATLFEPYRAADSIRAYGFDQNTVSLCPPPFDRPARFSLTIAAVA